MGSDSKAWFFTARLPNATEMNILHKPVWGAVTQHAIWRWGLGLFYFLQSQQLEHLLLILVILQLGLQGKFGRQ